MFSLRTPLAWKNLTHEPRRLVAAVLGIVFAVVLMFIQVGFMSALLDSTVALPKRLKGELLLVSKAEYALPAQKRFPRERLAQAAACPGVAAAHPVYLENFMGTLQRPGENGHPIRVIAFDPQTEAFTLPANEAAALPALQQPRAAWIDRKSKAKYAPDLLLKGAPAQLSGRSIEITGAFTLGADFANDGNLLMTPQTFAGYFPYRNPGRSPLDVVDLGVVRLADGADPLQVRAALAQRLPGDVDIHTREAFIARERAFWGRSTPVGYIFTVGTLMGFVVGVIICYQILHTQIADHMNEFATLKAMGYGNQYFMGIVFRKSAYLSVLGFIPGLLLSQIVYMMLASFTGLLMELSLGRALLVFVLTLGMCLLSGALAMRKVLAADPAELF